MPIAQAYFELRDVRPLDVQSWIPLREISEAALDLPSADVTRLETWTGIGTAAVELEHRTEADKLGWSHGLDVDTHRAGVESWGYRSSDIFWDWQKPLGINLVVDQHIEEGNLSIWHLHPDLVVALGLYREDDRWFRPVEGWAEVVRLHRGDDGRPRLIEIRSEFLRDYLAARGMVLYCSSYHERVMVSAARPAFSWPGDGFKAEIGRDRHEGIITDADYPDPPDQFWTRGALWRTEWVEPGKISTRVRGDDDAHTSTFVLENDGSRAAGSALDGVMSWLYFDPTLVTTLLRHRGGGLRWFSRETGALGATRHGVHFGVNRLGLITVFAKDIGRLAAWEQRLWAAHNVTPDGGVSMELFAAQMEARPAATVAPESELSSALDDLDKAFSAKHGGTLLRDHETVASLLLRAHRFHAAERDGLLELSKEVTRLFIERIDVDAILAVLGAPKKGDKKPGSLRALEKLVAHYRSDSEASTLMSPLFGIYDLRLADAHLGSSLVPSGLKRVGIDDRDPPAMQGRQLLESFIDTLRAITLAVG